jgi:hypothetical protein
MTKSKTIKLEDRNMIISKEDFLRVLDRAIKPHGQGTNETSEKSDSDDYSEKHTHSDNVEDI